MPAVTLEQLHQTFISALNGHVLSHSEIQERPLLIDLQMPLPQRIRLYLYTATHPPGGRLVGEHKIQLILPGQQRNQRANFDDSDGRIVVLAGLETETQVFILWDAGLYTDIPFSRNVQVKAETIYQAVAGKLGTQERRIKGKGIETVVTAPTRKLAQALGLRMTLTRERLLGEHR